MRIIGSREMILLVFVVMMALAIDPVFASTGAGGRGLPWESPLQMIQQSVSGPTALSITLLAIAAICFTMYFGKQIDEFIRVLIYIVLVAALLFGSAAFVANLFSGAVIPETAACEWVWEFLDVCK